MSTAPAAALKTAIISVSKAPMEEEQYQETAGITNVSLGFSEAGERLTKARVHINKRVIKLYYNEAPSL